MGKRAVDVSVDARDFVRVIGQAKAFDKKLYTGLRRDLRKAGADAAEASRVEVKKAPYKVAKTRRFRIIRGQKVVESDTIQHGKHELRQHIAKGIKISISAGASSRRVGVFIASRGSDPASKLLKKQWDKPKGFRHPVFADPKQSRDQWTWTKQYGRPYFGSVISSKQPAINRDIKKLLDRTLTEVALPKK